MAKIKLPDSVRKQFAAWGRKGGKAGKTTDKAKAGKASGETRRQKRQQKVDAAWSAYKKEHNGGGITDKARFIKRFFPKLKTHVTA